MSSLPTSTTDRSWRAKSFEQAFAQARAKLSLTAIPLLNNWLVERAQHHGFVRRWSGLRLVAADASTVRFGLRASHAKRAALADQILFGLFLPGCELMPAATLYSVQTSERQMLFEHLDRLSGSDLPLLDRCYPARWLVAALNQRGIPFCMRVEKIGNSGFACVRDFPSAAGSLGKWSRCVRLTGVTSSTLNARVRLKPCA